MIVKNACEMHERGREGVREGRKGGREGRKEGKRNEVRIQQKWGLVVFGVYRYS